MIRRGKQGTQSLVRGVVAREPGGLSVLTFSFRWGRRSQAGLQGAASPLTEREVSSLPPLSAAEGGKKGLCNCPERIETLGDKDDNHAI